MKSRSDKKCDAQPCPDALLVLRLVSNQSMKSQGGHDQTVRPSWQVRCTWVADIHLQMSQGVLTTSRKLPLVEKQPRALQEERSLPGLARTGQPAPGTSPTSSHGLCRHSTVRIENKLWSISDMLSPTLGRPPALPWWPDQHRPAGPTPSCAAITCQQLCHSPWSCQAGARRPPAPPSSCRPAASEQDGMSYW